MKKQAIITTVICSIILVVLVGFIFYKSSNEKSIVALLKTDNRNLSEVVITDASSPSRTVKITEEDELASFFQSLKTTFVINPEDGSLSGNNYYIIEIFKGNTKIGTVKVGDKVEVNAKTYTIKSGDINKASMEKLMKAASK